MAASSASGSTANRAGTPSRRKKASGSRSPASRSAGRMTPHALQKKGSSPVNGDPHDQHAPRPDAPAARADADASAANPRRPSRRHPSRSSETIPRDDATRAPTTPSARKVPAPPPPDHVPAADDAAMSRPKARRDARMAM